LTRCERSYHDERQVAKSTAGARTVIQRIPPYPTALPPVLPMALPTSKPRVSQSRAREACASLRGRILVWRVALLALILLVTYANRPSSI
jgi:GH25 family lysozyme M1 (1,4-beta-N-acetylmuramidase)